MVFKKKPLTASEYADLQEKKKIIRLMYKDDRQIKEICKATGIAKRHVLRYVADEEFDRIFQLSDYVLKVMGPAHATSECGFILNKDDLYAARNVDIPVVKNGKERRRSR